MPWKLLQIAPTSDEREIRRAYARILKTRQHEDDPDFFQKLRLAYERALERARWAAENEGAENDDILTDAEENAGGMDADLAVSPPVIKIPPSETVLPEAFFLAASAPVPEQSEDRLNPEDKDSQAAPNRTDETPRPAEADIAAEMSVSRDEIEAEQMAVELDALEKALDVSRASRWQRFGLWVRQLIFCGNPDREFKCSPASLSRWQTLRAHALMQRLDWREQVSERLVVMLVDHWPHSRAIWLQARDFLSWHLPTFSDYSPQGVALRYLFESEHEFSDRKAYRKKAGQRQERQLKKFFLYVLVVVLAGVAMREYATKAMLPIAVETGNLEQVELILAVGTRPRDSLTQAVQHYAAERDEASRAKRLQIISALVKEYFPDGKMLYEYRQRFTGINAPGELNQELERALTSALNHQDTRLFDAILAGGLRPDLVFIGENPLIFKTIETGRTDLLQTLHEYGADLNLRNKAGDTPLAVAACHKDMLIVNYLVRQGVEITDAHLQSEECGKISTDAIQPFLSAETENFKTVFGKAAQNDAQAQDALGTLYRSGQEVTPNDMEALKWYQKAAEQGYARAQNNLGQMYFEGWGRAQDMEQAFQWFQKAAEQGFAPAQFNLGQMYLDGYGVPQNFAEAGKWYRKAAAQGHVSAQNNLGILFENGQGVAQSDQEAVTWFRKAAEQGDASAQYNLGLMYYEGRGVTQSDTKTVNWWRKAAEQGHGLAQYNLGAMYSDGSGVAQDNTTAYMWVSLAIARSNPNASYYPAFEAFRAELARRLNASQMARAEQLAGDWEARFQAAGFRDPPHDARPGVRP